MSEKRCYTVQELQEILGVSRPTIYNLLKKKEFRWIQLDGGKYRISKKSFYNWLDNLEQNIALANFRWKKLSQSGIRGSNGNIKYLTFDEASYLAKVSRSMINKWADTGKFTVIKVGSRVRIRRDEFEDWMEQRDLERSMQ